jgi:hypothetical protein
MTESGTIAGSLDPKARATVSSTSMQILYMIDSIMQKKGIGYCSAIMIILCYDKNSVAIRGGKFTAIVKS